MHLCRPTTSNRLPSLRAGIPDSGQRAVIDLHNRIAATTALCSGSLEWHQIFSGLAVMKRFGRPFWYTPQQFGIGLAVIPKEGCRVDCRCCTR